MIKSENICICDRCGHRWLPESMPPKRCAKCKTPNWNKKVKELYSFPVFKIDKSPALRMEDLQFVSLEDCIQNLADGKLDERHE